MTTRGKCTKLSDQFSDSKDRDIATNAFTRARALTKSNFNTVNQIVQSISLFVRISLLVIRSNVLLY